jgi:hypothetical protein
MKMYTYQDFDKKDGWLLFRIKTHLSLKQTPEASTFPEVYALMDLPSGFLFGTEVASEELTSQQLDKLLKAGLAQKGKLPSRLMIAVEDPAAAYLHQFATRLQLKFESAPMESFEEFTAPVNETFNRSFSSASSTLDDEDPDMDQDEDFKCAIQSIPDSYDLCPCASGKKYIADQRQPVSTQSVKQSERLQEEKETETKNGLLDLSLKGQDCASLLFKEALFAGYSCMFYIDRSPKVNFYSVHTFDNLVDSIYL